MGHRRAYDVRATLLDGTVDRIEGFATAGRQHSGLKTSQWYGSINNITNKR